MFSDIFANSLSVALSKFEKWFNIRKVGLKNSRILNRDTKNISINESNFIF